MKSLNSLENSPSRHRAGMVNVVAVADKVRRAVHEAAVALTDATQKCLAAGQALLEAKAQITRPRVAGQFVDQGDDGFEAWVKANIPEVHIDTARRWMRAARNVVKALPAPKGIDTSSGVIEIETISISEIIGTPDADLPAAAREYKQAWFDFTADKTIKDCLSGVCVEGDDAHKIDRVINGKTKGGHNGENRKDFPLFVLRKLKETSAHLGHWETMDAIQRNEVLTVFTAAILGDFVNLPGRTAGKATFEAWPEDICEALVTVLKKRLKG